MKDPTQQSNIVPTDSPSIYEMLSSTQKLALVLPNGSPPGGVAGFFLDIPKEQSGVFESDITDHYIEDNTAVNDQIALHPEKITLRGVVAELTFNDLGISEVTPSLPPPRRLPFNFPFMPIITDAAQQVAGVGVGLIMQRANFVANGPLSPVLTGKVSALSAGGITGMVGTVLAFAPGLSPELGFLQQDLADMDEDQIDQMNLSMVGALAGGASPAPTPPPTLSSFFDQQIGNNPGLTRQAAAVGYFYQLWKGRVLFTIQTVWGIFESMAIERFSPSQDESTAYQTNLEITFKKIRIAGDLITPVLGSISGRAYAMQVESVPTQLGFAGLQPVSSSDQTALFSSLTL
jgi:hypothetical protein